ncbi:MAG: acyl-CoA dehydrogenase family protein [Chloroflexi bacterium]|nr:acyl-CoA dehydrogenase family protein [Chloroflexota bacterium]
MDFTLTEEQISFRKLFRDFAAKEIAKVAKHTDESEQPPLDLFNKAAQQGFFAAMIPEDLGGAALDPLSYTLLIEELAKACMSTAITIATHNSLVVYPIVSRGNAEQKENWLSMLAENAGALALNEPDAGSDTSHLSTRAKRTNDGYVINGVKTWVTNAGIAKLLLVIAQTDNGPTAFVIDPATPGVKIGHREPTTGLRGVTFHTVYFDAMGVSETDRLGNEGEGLSLLQTALSHFQLAIAAAALGLDEHAVAQGRAFAIERKQFGVSIATKQGLGNYFADAEINTEVLRHQIEYAAWLYEQGKDFAAAALKAKLFGAKAARETANHMLQVHGGYGFSDEYTISQLYRDARALDLLGGTPQVGRIAVWQEVFADSGVVIKP